jgi:DNA primase
MPLEDAVWLLERGRAPLETPEDYAGLEQRLERLCGLIADTGVRNRYRALYRDRVNDAFREARQSRQSGYPHKSGHHYQSAWTRRAGGGGSFRPVNRPPRPGDPRPVLERILLAAIINHPLLLAEADEALGRLQFSVPELDNLRQRILELAATPGLDSRGLEIHLQQAGLADVVERVRAPDVFLHAGFAKPGAEEATLRTGWRQTLARYRRPLIDSEVEAAARALAQNPSPEAELRVHQTREEQNRLESLAVDGDE